MPLSTAVPVFKLVFLLEIVFWLAFERQPWIAVIIRHYLHMKPHKSKNPTASRGRQGGMSFK
jgi:hypothetical protein